ncbi:MAG: hypothetical protein ACTSYR_02530 [Candidatus Odinarchaeia archaeon]
MAPIVTMVKGNPYSIKNYGVGFGAIPIEIGMEGEINGGYQLQYTPPTENGYAQFLMRNTTNIKFERIFNEQAYYAEKNIPIFISPEDWAPGEGGELAFVELNLVVETDTGVYYDNSSVWFYIQRAGVTCELKNISVYDNSTVQVQFEVCNEHNSTVKVKKILVNVEVSSNDIILKQEITRTDDNGVFKIFFTPDSLNSPLEFRILTSGNDDYESGVFNIKIPSITFDNSEIQITPEAYTYFEEDEGNKITIEVNLKNKVYDYVICKYLNYKFTLNKINESFFNLTLNPPLNPGTYPLIFEFHNNSGLEYLVYPINIKPRNAIIYPIEINWISSNSLDLKIKIIDSKTGIMVTKTGILKVYLIRDNIWVLLQNFSVNDEIINLNINLLNVNTQNTFNIKIVYEAAMFNYTESVISVEAPQHNMLLNSLIIISSLVSIGVAIYVYRKIKKRKEVEIV